MNTLKRKHNDEEPVFAPLLLHVPHASLGIPEDIRGELLPEDLSPELLRMTDRFCDELFLGPWDMIKAPVSRLVCDMERFRDDNDEIMAKMGMGAVYTRCADGSVLRELDPERREAVLRRFYDPHHEKLTKSVLSRCEEHGYCLIVDGHSFSPVPLPHEGDQNPDRCDFCIGTDPFHTPRSLALHMKAFCEERGYSVELDRPFSGTMVPMACYQKDPRVLSVMLEINRRLYMDENGEKTKNFSVVREFVFQWICELMKEAVLLHR